MEVTRLCTERALESGGGESGPAGRISSSLSLEEGGGRVGREVVRGGGVWAEGAEGEGVSKLST